MITEAQTIASNNDQTQSSARLATLVCFFVGSLILYTVAVINLDQLVFDEAHYVPAARAMIEGKTNPIPEHPPLGIMLIASSILIAGDTPFGWRLGSMLAGSWLLVGLLLLCRRLSLRRIVYVGCLLLTSHFIYIHARIAMLDIYMCALFVWALVALNSCFLADKLRSKWWLLAVSALLWGLATAVKWVAVVGFAIAVLHIIVIKMIGKRFPAVGKLDRWYDDRYLQGLSLLSAVGCYLLFFIGGYSVPHLLLGESNVIDAVVDAWQLQHRVPVTHNYHSPMLNWPLLLRPIWYEYRQIGDGLVRGVFCLGNPVIMLAGLLSILWSICSWWRQQSMLAFLILIYYGGFYLCWTVVSREASFHYYYFPAVLFMTLSLGVNLSSLLDGRWRVNAWLVLAFAVIFFVYFYPVLSGISFPLNEHLRLWAWFQVWI